MLSSVISSDKSTNKSSSLNLVNLGVLSSVFALGFCILVALLGYKYSIHKFIPANDGCDEVDCGDVEAEYNFNITGDETNQPPRALPLAISSNFYADRGTAYMTALVIPPPPTIDIEPCALEMVVISPSLEQQPPTLVVVEARQV